MSAKPSADVQTSLRWVSRCKGTKKNIYVQEKFYFYCHRLHFLIAPSQKKCAYIIDTLSYI